MKRLGVLLLIGLTVLTAFPHGAMADYQLQDAIREFGEKRWIKPEPTRIKAGPLRFHPYMKTSFQYDDNVLLTKSKTKKDFVFNVSPGTIIEIPMDKHQLAIGYEADFETLAINSHQNLQDQHFFALGDFHFPDWYVNVLEKMDAMADRAGTTFTSKVPRLDNLVNPKMGYKWQRATFEAGFRHFIRDYKRHIDKQYDFQELAWTGVFYYDLFAKLKALVDYTFSQLYYTNNTTRNAAINQARLGLEGEVMPGLFVKTRIGPQFRTYRKNRHDFNSFVASAGAEYKFRKNWRFELEANKEAIEATFGDVNYYNQYGIRFLAEYKFRPQWIGYAQFHYYRNNYAERATVDDQTGYRHDNHYEPKVGIRYLFRDWLEFEMSYEFYRRGSNFTTQSYTDNRFTFSTLLKY